MDAAVERLPAMNHVVFRLAMAGGARVVKLARTADGSSVAKELHVLGLLARHGVPAPVVEHADPDGARVGRPCFVMRSAGESTVLDALRGPGETAASLFRQMGTALATVHGVAVGASGDIRPDGTIVPRDRAGWLARVHALAGQLMAAGALEAGEVARFRALPMPAIEGGALCHGDFHAVQCVVRAGRLTAVVDWHEAWAGNPLIDLGIAHAYLDLYSPPPLVAAFLAGYAAAAPLPADYDRVTAPVRMAQAMALARVSRARGRAQDARRAVELFRGYGSRSIE